MKTKSKIALAAAVSEVVRCVRKLQNKPETAEFRRGGFTWELDLSQGIDFAIFLQGGFEPRTLRDYKKNVKPGWTVLDIGANIGAHTLPLAELVGETGRVIAFEPTDYAFGKLKKNLELNPEIKKRVEAVQAMLVGEPNAEKPTEGIPSSWSLAAETDGEIHPGHGGKFQTLNGAMTTQLDTWIEKEGLDNVSFIKMDVDGYEIDVLKGAKKTLEKWRPTMMMEFMPYVFADRGQNFGEVLTILNSLGYSCRTVTGQPLEMNEHLEGTIAHGSSINVILEAGEKEKKAA
jgi:FkbM family methyltransferase